MYATLEELNTALTASGLSLGTLTDAQKDQAIRAGTNRCDLSLRASGKVSFPLPTPYCANLVKACTSYALANLLFATGKNPRLVTVGVFKTNFDASNKWLNGVATTGVVA